jgi:hypothetical protein
LGSRPPLATRADSGEVLCARRRKGAANTARGVLRLVDELVARLRRAGTSGKLTLRMGAGFWLAKLVRRLPRHRLRCSVTVRQAKTVRAAVAAVPSRPGSRPPTPRPGSPRSPRPATPGDRLVVRRLRDPGDQAQPVATRRYHAFVTNRVGTITWLDADRRRHAVGELAIRDPKTGAGLAHLPAGRFAANAAWLLAALAHHLLGWTARLGLGARD